MNETPDTHETDNGNPLDPAAAAALLDQATQQARRSFQPNPVNAWLIMAIGLCAAFLAEAVVTVLQQRRSVVHA